MDQELIDILRQAAQRGDFAITLIGSRKADGELQFQARVGCGEIVYSYNYSRSDDDYRAYAQRTDRISCREPQQALEDAIYWIEDNMPALERVAA